MGIVVIIVAVIAGIWLIGTLAQKTGLDKKMSEIEAKTRKMAQDAHIGVQQDALDKQLTQNFILTLVGIGMPGKDAENAGPKYFEETKANAITNFGDNIYSETLGYEVIKNQKMTAPLLALGLTLDDIKEYWNIPPIVNLCRMKTNEINQMAFYSFVEQQGGDIETEYKNYVKDNVQYGNPANWDLALQRGRGLTEVDAPLPSEFFPRIQKWLKSQDPEALRKSKLASLIVKCGFAAAAFSRQVMSVAGPTRRSTGKTCLRFAALHYGSFSGELGR